MSKFGHRSFLVEKSQKKPKVGQAQGQLFSFRSYAEDVCNRTFKIPNNKFALRLYGSYKAIGTGNHGRFG